MRRYAIALIILLCVSACFRHHLQSAMDSWIGGSQTDLVSQWGAPDLTSAQPDSSKVLTWIKHYTETYPGVAQPVPRECRQSFTVSPSGRILHWSLGGRCG